MPHTAPTSVPAPTAVPWLRRQRWRWPAWVPYAAAGWGVLYAVVQAGWAVAGVRVPLTAHSAYLPGAQLLLAALALLAAGAALGSARAAARGVAARGLSGALWLMATVFTLGTFGLPMHVVSLASGSGGGPATGLVQLLLHTCGAGLLLLTALAHTRRRRGRCPRCGGPHQGRGEGPLAYPAASRAPARTRRTVWLLLCGLLPWAAVKTVWTLGGDALGVTGAEWRRLTELGGSAPVRALAAVGVDITVLATLPAIFLLLGLLYPWGQVFPRWAPPLSGRRVPRLLPLIPAWSTAATLATYGVLLTVGTPLSALGVLPRPEADEPFDSSADVLWMIGFGGLAFGGLGLALLVAAYSYGARTRPYCAAPP